MLSEYSQARSMLHCLAVFVPYNYVYGYALDFGMPYSMVLLCRFPMGHPEPILSGILCARLG